MSNASTGTIPSGSSPELDRSPTVVRVNDEVFNIPSPQRKVIIRRLKKALLDQPVPAPFWAVIQLCDLDKLEYLIQLAYFSLKLMDIVADLTCGLPFKWTLRPSPFQQADPEYSPPVFSPPKHRSSPVAIYAARERDGKKCVITGTRKIYQTVPIFPTGLVTSRLQDNPTSPTIWRFADMFWGRITTQKWRKAAFNNPIQPDSPVNDCSNLICLRRDLRSAWTSGLFALRPAWINEEETEIEIEFYWQPKLDHKVYDVVELTKQPPSSKNVNSVDKLVVVPGVRGEPTYRPIVSGYRFKMTTDDPIERPLPSFDLLDMQWHFNRMLALSGASSFFEDDYEDEDDNRSDVTTQSKQPSDLDEEEILAWVKSSISTDSSPESDFVEDIGAAMIGPLPGLEANTDRLRSVSQGSRGSARSAGSPGSAGSVGSTGAESSADMLDVISGTGHLSLDFEGN
ncbi:hypothetical protein PENVUL_c001G03988 [Penicillium vulpinum]|uniref:HNH nuclease domain-containing protein n=2 Tax=Penicillium vulpinum TaxID=29845 RepID=A0A1V6SES2_9EURO|nr:hypothetical protein PENVUL_c001G03988 [Penicillium vulpinum]